MTDSLTSVDHALPNHPPGNPVPTLTTLFYTVCRADPDEFSWVWAYAAGAGEVELFARVLNELSSFDALALINRQTALSRAKDAPRDKQKASERSSEEENKFQVSSTTDSKDKKGAALGAETASSTSSDSKAKKKSKFDAKPIPAPIAIPRSGFGIPGIPLPPKSSNSQPTLAEAISARGKTKALGKVSKHTVTKSTDDPDPFEELARKRTMEQLQRQGLLQSPKPSDTAESSIKRKARSKLEKPEVVVVIPPIPPPPPPPTQIVKMEVRTSDEEKHSNTNEPPWQHLSSFLHMCHVALHRRPPPRHILKAAKIKKEVSTEGTSQLNKSANLSMEKIAEDEHDDEALPIFKLVPVEPALVQAARTGQAHIVSLLLAMPWANLEITERGTRTTALMAAMMGFVGAARRQPTRQRLHVANFVAKRVPFDPILEAKLRQVAALWAKEGFPANETIASAMMKSRRELDNLKTMLTSATNYTNEKGDTKNRTNFDKVPLDSFEKGDVPMGTPMLAPLSSSMSVTMEELGLDVPVYNSQFVNEPTAEFSNTADDETNIAILQATSHAESAARGAKALFHPEQFMRGANQTPLTSSPLPPAQATPLGNPTPQFPAQVNAYDRPYVQNTSFKLVTTILRDRFEPQNNTMPDSISIDYSNGKYDAVPTSIFTDFEHAFDQLFSRRPEVSAELKRCVPPPLIESTAPLDSLSKWSGSKKGSKQGSKQGSVSGSKSRKGSRQGSRRGSIGNPEFDAIDMGGQFDNDRIVSSDMVGELARNGREILSAPHSDLGDNELINNRAVATDEDGVVQLPRKDQDVDAHSEHAVLTRRQKSLLRNDKLNDSVNVATLTEEQLGLELETFNDSNSNIVEREYDSKDKTDMPVPRKSRRSQSVSRHEGADDVVNPEGSAIISQDDFTDANARSPKPSSIGTRDSAKGKRSVGSRGGVPSTVLSANASTFVPPSKPMLVMLPDRISPHFLDAVFKGMSSTASDGPNYGSKLVPEKLMILDEDKNTARVDSQPLTYTTSSTERRANFIHVVPEDSPVATIPFDHPKNGLSIGPALAPIPKPGIVDSPNAFNPSMTPLAQTQREAQTLMSDTKLELEQLNPKVRSAVENVELSDTFTVAALLYPTLAMPASIQEHLSQLHTNESGENENTPKTNNTSDKVEDLSSSSTSNTLQSFANTSNHSHRPSLSLQISVSEISSSQMVPLPLTPSFVKSKFVATVMDLPAKSQYSQVSTLEPQKLENESMDSTSSVLLHSDQGAKTSAGSLLLGRNQILVPVAGPSLAQPLTPLPSVRIGLPAPVLPQQLTSEKQHLVNALESDKKGTQKKVEVSNKAKESEKKSASANSQESDIVQAPLPLPLPHPEFVASLLARGVSSRPVFSQLGSNLAFIPIPRAKPTSGQVSNTPVQTSRTALTDTFETVVALIGHGARLDAKNRESSSVFSMVPNDALNRLGRWSLRLGLIRWRQRSYVIRSSLRSQIFPLFWKVVPQFSPLDRPGLQLAVESVAQKEAAERKARDMNRIGGKNPAAIPKVKFTREIVPAGNPNELAGRAAAQFKASLLGLMPRPKIFIDSANDLSISADNAEGDDDSFGAGYDSLDGPPPGIDRDALAVTDVILDLVCGYVGQDKFAAASQLPVRGSIVPLLGNL